MHRVSGPAPEPDPGLEARRARREAARRRVQRQRWLAVLTLFAVALIAVAAIALPGGSGSGGATAAEEGEPEAKKPPPPPELPRGGRELFPRHRVVAFYGAPQNDELGALGIGSPREAGRKLLRQARAYRRGGRTLLPAMELIGVIASNAPGADNNWSYRQRHETVRAYHRAARRIKALLVIDIQPGHADWMRETRYFARYLREPDVGLALDPEWATPGRRPGTVIGTMDASAVNRVQRYLAALVRKHDLPEKLLIVHQFTEDMITNKQRLRRYPGVRLVLNVDGFGGREIKIKKYADFASFTRRRKEFRNGFKLFYKEDTNLLEPRDVLRMRPRPDLVIYE